MEASLWKDFEHVVMDPTTLCGGRGESDGPSLHLAEVRVGLVTFQFGEEVRHGCDLAIPFRKCGGWFLGGLGVRGGISKLLHDSLRLLILLDELSHQKLHGVGHTCRRIGGRLLLLLLWLLLLLLLLWLLLSLGLLLLW